MTDIKKDPGSHYRNIINIQLTDSQIKAGSLKLMVDPDFIQMVCGPMTGMQFIILKKAIMLGKGGKTKEQDLRDIINAAQIEIELMGLEP